MEPTYQGYTGNNPRYNQSLDAASKASEAHQQATNDHEAAKRSEQKIELQQQQLQLQRQQQETNQKLMFGGFVLASILTIVIVAFLIAKMKHNGTKN